MYIAKFLKGGKFLFFFFPTIISILFIPHCSEHTCCLTQMRTPVRTAVQVDSFFHTLPLPPQPGMESQLALSRNMPDVVRLWARPGIWQTSLFGISGLHSGGLLPSVWV